MIVFLRNIKTYCKECSKLPRVLLEFFVVLIHPAGVLGHLLALSVHLRLASLQLSDNDNLRNFIYSGENTLLLTF